MNDKKYELTNETIYYCGHTLHRIRAMRDFGVVGKGDIGGLIEKESNLSHDGNCWVAGGARVYSDAMVADDAMVRHDARVCDAAFVCGNADVFGDAVVGGNTTVCDNAEVYGRAFIYGDAEIFGDADVFGNARVGGNAKVYGYAEVFGHAIAVGNSEVFGDAEVGGNAQVCGEARIERTSDYIVFKNWWSSGRYFTWTRSNNLWKVGCFYGTGEELIARAYKDSEESGREYERVVRYVESIIAEGREGAK